MSTGRATSPICAWASEGPTSAPCATGVIAVPTGQFHQAVENRGLFRFRAPFIGGAHLLGDRITLAHR